jgi:hypothetical protein
MMPEDNIKTSSGNLHGTADAGATNGATINTKELPTTYEEIEGDRGELACAVCGNPYLPEQLTVVSHERFNFESAVVACPVCLENMKQETKARTTGSNLGMASLWAFIVFLIFTVITGLLLFFNRSMTIDIGFRYLGAYLAIFPGFAIGKAVFYSSGQKESLAQRLIAVGFTALYMYISLWVACSSYINYQFDIIRPDGHDLMTVPFADPLFIYLPQILDAKVLSTRLWLPFAVIGAGLIALAAAYISSGGERLYTRPYVTKTAKA